MRDQNLLQERQAHYRTIAEGLQMAYGYPTWRQHLPPVDELVSTILSQATSDGNRDKGFYALKARFRDWESVRDASVAEIQATIHSAGLAAQKAPRIKDSLQYLTEKTGKISLDFLEDMSPGEAKTWLMQMEGIGPKTAAIILCFAFNKPAFPVDTHVHRVTTRLGLIGEKISADKAHDELEAIVPPEDYYAAHLNIIRHGREVCKARRPLCHHCNLTAYCAYYQMQGKAAALGSS